MSSRSRLALASMVLLTAGSAQGFTLNVLHINDFHSRIEAVNAYDSTCTAEEDAAGECFGGVARMQTAINAARKEIKAAGEAVILLDAGDQFQGSLFFSTYSGKAEMEFMNRIGFDAMVLGNHEFDLGPAPLAAFLAGVKFPVVFGNTETTAQSKLAPFDRDPVILTAGGRRIGIVGVVTPETAEISTPGPDVSFADPIQTVTEAVADLEAQGVTHIIALTHQGVSADVRLAEAVAGLDAIIGGHTHTLFSNTIEGASFAYPHRVEGPDGREVPIVSAGSYSKYLGHLTLTFDEAGEVTEAGGDTMLLDASIQPDVGALNRIKQLAAPIEALKSEVVAEIANPIDGSRETCRAQECAMGNLVADAMLARVAEQGVDLAIQSGGGLRASIDAGEVTRGDVLAVLPFQNTLATFNLPGAEIVAALENGVSQVEEGGGRFPQVAGLEFTWDPSAAPSEGRVREVRVRDGETWVPIDPAKTYTVVTNNFMRGGGDGYAMFRDAGSNAYDFGPNLEDVLADYLAANPDYMPQTNGRINRIE